MTAHWLRDILKDAKKLGWTMVGYDGNGHPRLYNAEVNRYYSAPLTPSDWRARRNCLADLERLSGRKLPRAKSGKYHHHRVTQLVIEQSNAEMQTAAEVDVLVATADSLRRRFDELSSMPVSRDVATEARDVLDEYQCIRRRLAAGYRDIGPINGVLTTNRRRGTS